MCFTDSSTQPLPFGLAVLDIGQGWLLGVAGYGSYDTHIKLKLVFGAAAWPDLVLLAPFGVVFPNWPYSAMQPPPENRIPGECDLWFLAPRVASQHLSLAQISGIPLHSLPVPEKVTKTF